MNKWRKVACALVVTFSLVSVVVFTGCGSPSGPVGDLSGTVSEDNLSLTSGDGGVSINFSEFDVDLDMAVSVKKSMWSQLNQTQTPRFLPMTSLSQKEPNSPH